MNRTRNRVLIAMFVVLGLVGAACGSDDDGATGESSAASVASSAATVASSDASVASSAASAEPVATTAGDEAAAEDLEQLDLTMAGSSSSSSVYAFLAAHARAGAEADGAMSIQVRETGASVENFQLVLDGAADFGITSVETLYQARLGEGQFEEAMPDLVNLMNYLKVADFIVVRADAGIETVQDLQGKSFAYGFQGSGGAVKTENMLKALGVEVEPFVGGLEDIVNAMKDGRIVGFGKSANGLEADASMLDVASTVPVTLLGFDEEQIATMEAQYPYWEFGEIPAGALPEQDEPVMSAIFYAGYFARADMDEDTAYRLTKGLWEGIEQAQQESGHKGALGRTPEETVATQEVAPVHPGAMRYYQEVGAA